MTKLVLILLASAVVIILYNGVVIGTAAARGTKLAKASVPFTVGAVSPASKVLVVGDSTAVGTGASSPNDSIAGRIAADFPNTTVLNHAADGALTEAVPAQLRRAAQVPYNLVLIQVGGNDALRFTTAKDLRHAIESSLSIARSISQNVLLVSVGDLGKAPAVPWPLSMLFSYRAQVVRDVFLEVASSKSVHFLDLLALSEEGSPFQQNTQKYYAVDGLHPSSAGYALWYDKLRDSAALNQWLNDAEAQQ